MKRVLFCILFLLGSSYSYAQIDIIKQEDVFQIGKNNSVDIKVINNTILLPIKLANNLKVYFILDTGVTTPIITDDIITTMLDLTHERSFQLKGYGMDKPLLAHVADGFEYSVGNFEKPIREKVIILDKPLFLNEFLGEPVYGILGYSFLKNFHVKIDFQRKNIYLTEPEDAKNYPKKYKQFDVEWIANRAFVNLPVRNQSVADTLKLMIDTGFTGALNLYPHKENILQKEQPFIDDYLGIGLNGLITSRLFKTEELDFNNYFQLHSVTTNLLSRASLINTNIQNYSDGSIGTEILRRFTLVIDYKNKKLYLRKKSEFGDAFHYNAAGIRVREQTDEKGKKAYKISHLRHLSHADLIGLFTEDVILSIDGKPVRNKSINEVYERLNDFSHPFRKILVKRNDLELTFEFKINTTVPWN